MSATSTNPNDPTYDDEDYYLAPQSQRAFSAGIKRKRVVFVPASSDDPSTAQAQPQPHAPSNAGARYLSIVLGSKTQDSSTEQTSDTTGPSTPTPEPNVEQEPITLCPICAQPTTPSTLKAHTASITHQLHLEHSHPPSHLDRSRKGLKYLEGYGWDPDARVGLGARSEGIRVPVRAREKRDTAGLGLFGSGGDDEDHSVRKTRVEKRSEGDGVVRRLNAKQVRRMEDEKKKRAEKLRSTFYGEDLSRYLGEGG